MITDKRKLVEQAFGWMKTVALLRKLRHRGGARVEWIFLDYAGRLIMRAIAGQR